MKRKVKIPKFQSGNLGTPKRKFGDVPDWYNPSTSLFEQDYFPKSDGVEDIYAEQRNTLNNLRGAYKTNNDIGTKQLIWDFENDFQDMLEKDSGFAETNTNLVNLNKAQQDLQNYKPSENIGLTPSEQMQKLWVNDNLPANMYRQPLTGEILPVTQEGIFQMDQKQMVPGVTPDSPYQVNQKPLNQTKKIRDFGLNAKNYTNLQMLNSGIDAIGNMYNQGQQDQSIINQNPLSSMQFSNGRSNQSKYGYSFQKGGTKQNPPKVYNQITTSDSLALYNNTKALLKIYNKENGYDLQGTEKQPILSQEDVRKIIQKNIYNRTNIPKQISTNDGVLSNITNFFTGTSLNKNFKIDDYYKKINNYQYNQRELATGVLNMDAPMGKYDTRIPVPYYKKFINRSEGDIANVPMYDAIVIKPSHMKTEADWAYVKKNFPELYKNPNKQTINTTKGLVKGKVIQNDGKNAAVWNSQLVQTKPTHPITNMKRLSMPNYYIDNPNIQMQGKTIPLPEMRLPQQGNIPFYGPGNTIVGYTDNSRQFYPAQQYTGAANNQVNLQDKELLNNPELLRKYVQSKDTYKFQSGGFKWDNEDDDFLFGDDEETTNAAEQPRQNDEEVVNQELQTEVNQEEEDINNALYAELMTPYTRKGYKVRKPMDNTDYVTGPTLKINPSTNKTFAFNYLQQKGLAPHQAAGIVGNFAQESNVNPSITNSIGAFGAGQWLGARKKALFEFAKRNGQDPSNLQTQLDFTMHELNTTEKGAFNALKNTKTSAEAARVIRKKYERPGEHEANDNRRIQEAHKLHPFQDGGFLLNDHVSSFIRQPKIKKFLKANGNPKLYQEDGIRANYDPVDNQINFDQVSDLIPEFSHVVQKMNGNIGGNSVPPNQSTMMRDNNQNLEVYPTSRDNLDYNRVNQDAGYLNDLRIKNTNNTGSMANAFVKKAFGNIYPQSYLDKLSDSNIYMTPGSGEYEAHQLIEPNLGSYLTYQKGGIKINFPKFDPTIIQQKPIIENTNPIKRQPIVQNIWIDPQTGLPMTQLQADMVLAAQRNQNPGKITKTVPRSTKQNIIDVVSNPMTSAQQLINKQPVTGRGARNVYDNALDIVNPVTYAKAIKNTAKNVVHPIETSKKLANTGMGSLEYILDGSTNRNVGEGFGVIMDGLMTAQAVKSATPYLKQAVNNTYKINPWRYKPENGKMFRGLNEEGYNDAIQSGVFRSKQVVAPIIPKGTNINIAKQFGTDPYFTPKFNTAKSYGADYIAEVPRDVANWTNRYKRSDWSQYADRMIPISEGKILKKDWLQGYKEVPKTNFKSEIDWAKWNKEIPSNQPLLQEYNAIEKATKANGNWMKNPDGSAFQGTPEQFVQQQSQNFKNAFGNSKLVNPDGSPTIQYHGSAKKFDTFDESKFQLGDSGYSGQGIYTTPSKTTANSYATSSAKFHNGEINPTVYELYGQANNPISSSQLIKEGNNRDLFNFHRKRNWKGELTPKESLLEYDAAIADQLPNVENIRPWNDAREIVFPTNKQLKSSIGNNGMFDMTNPNIYKALVPAIGAGVLSQKKLGGKMNDNKGYLINNLHNFTPKKVNNSSNNTIVKPSNIQGKGLFANKMINSDEFIGLAHENGQPVGKIGNYHNHSENPNSESILIGNKRYIKAKRPLFKGEEITVDYRQQPELEQPNNFQKGGTYYASNADIAKLKQKNIKFRYV